MVSPSLDNTERSPRLVVNHQLQQDQRISRRRAGGLKRWVALALVSLAVVVLFGFGLATGRFNQVALPLFHRLTNSAERASENEAEPPPSPPNVFALGRLEPEGEVLAVAAPSGAGEARVELLKAHEGMQVRTGDILAVLDSESRLLAAVQVSEDSLQQARARLGKTEIEIETASRRARAALSSSESKLATAKIQLRRMERLRGANAASQDELEQHQLDVATAEQVVEDARAQVARYETASPGEPLPDIVLAREEIRTAEASLQQARANLEQAYVRAPIDGEILRLNVRVGERIGQQPLLEMGQTSRMWARVEVYESEIPRLKTAQQVAMTASPLQRPLEGKLERISTLVRQQSVVNAIPAANTDARVIEVWVRLSDASSEQAARFVNLQVRAEFIQ